MLPRSRPVLTLKPNIVKVNKVLKQTKIIQLPVPYTRTQQPKIQVTKVQAPQNRTTPKPTAKSAVSRQSYVQIKQSNGPKHNTVKGIVAAKRGIKPRHRSTNVVYNTREITEESRTKIRKLSATGKGKILVIVGNGPSMMEVDLTPLLGNDKIEIMSINKPDPKLWPTNYWLFCDTTQYRRHEELWANYSTGTIITTTAIKQQKRNSLQIKNIGGKGFSRNLTDGFNIGRSSVYAAMQVALWMEYDHIYIFGCDMAAVVIDGEERVWSYGINPDVKPKNRVSRFDQEAQHYVVAAAALRETERQKYTFCSSYLKYDFVNKFNHLDHKEAVEVVLNRAATIADA